MARIKVRVTDDGDKRFVACYRDPEGRQRSAGTFSSRRAAERAANREEAKVRRAPGRPPRGEVTFAEYVETVGPVQAGRDLHPGRVPVLPQQALHSGLRAPADGQDPPLRGSALGHHRHRERSLRSLGGQVPHHAALGVRSALRDRVVTFNPRAHTELPKRVKRRPAP